MLLGVIPTVSASVRIVKMSEKNPVVLSFGDTIIRNLEMDILKSKQWFNDQIIGFYFEYCQLNKFPESRLNFIGPEVTQCIKLMQTQELSIVLDPLNINLQKAQNNCGHLNSCTVIFLMSCQKFVYL